MTSETTGSSLGRQLGEVRAAAPLQVAVFSNQELIRAGLTSLLGSDAERVLVSNGPGPALRHDVVLFDLVTALGEARGAVLRHLRRLLESGHVVVAVARDPGDDMGRRASALGCAAVVPVSVTAEELIGVLESVAGEPTAGQEAPPPVLTKRETEIVELVARGLSNTEIASELFLSVNSVKTYIRTAYRKMGVTTRSQAVLWAVRAGLSEPPHPQP